VGSHRADSSTPELGGHGHGHGHGPGPELDLPLAPRLVLLAVLAVLAALTVFGGVHYWPDKAEADKLKGSVGFAGEGVTFPEAVVDSVAARCPTQSVTASGPTAQPEGCGKVAATIDDTGSDDGTKVSVDVPPEVSDAGLAKGDRIELIRSPGAEGQPASYGYFGIHRTTPLWLITGLFVVVVLLVARLRGLMALVGLGVAGVVLGLFALPAMLTGEPALAVALVASAAIMYVVLYTTHGFSMRTSAALGGTLVGMVITAAIAWWSVGSAHLTGVVDTGGQLLTTYAAKVSTQDVLVAAVVIAGLGILNDVTITQASAVWELRGAAPDMTRARLFTSAMRIGRDHIASTIYTIVFAYAGTALTLLLAVSLYDRSIWDLVTTEELAEEVVRSFTSSIGLVLAVPVTTLIAVLTVPGPRDSLDR
jgi:uncharacterized membrane protein